METKQTKEDPNKKELVVIQAFKIACLCDYKSSPYLLQTAAKKSPQLLANQPQTSAETYLQNVPSQSKNLFSQVKSNPGLEEVWELEREGGGRGESCLHPTLKE